MRRMKLFFFILSCAGTFLLTAADARNFPVIAHYCDDTSLSLYPYSFVTTGSGSTFSCYDVQVQDIADGRRYSFEDSTDADYNDVIIDVTIANDGTGQPAAQVRFVSKDASYLHWIHLVYEGADVLVFKAEDAQPGAVFDVPLPVRGCPDFSLAVTPASQQVFQASSTSYTVQVSSLNTFADPVNLSIEGLPALVTAGFSPNPVTPSGESVLTLAVGEEAAVGEYRLTIRGQSGETGHTAEAILRIEEKPCPDFSLTIKAEPQTGSVPLEVYFQAIIGQAVSGRQGRGGKAVESYTYRWNFGDGGSSTGANPVHRYEAAGTYDVSLRVENSCGTVKEAQTTITASSLAVSFQKGFSVGQARPGEPVTMNLRVTNLSDTPFNQVTIGDEISPSLVYVDDDSGVSSSLDGQKRAWRFPVLKGRGVISFNVSLRVADQAQPGIIRNTAYLYQESLRKAVPSNTASLEIKPLTIEIIKGVDKGQAQPGDILAYTLAVKNDSAVTFTQVTVKDELPQELDFIDSSSDLILSRQGNALTWQGNVEAGKEARVTVRAKIRSTVLSGTLIANRASVISSRFPEPVQSNTVYTRVTAEPIPSSKVQFSKRADSPQTEVGRMIRFKLLVENRASAPLLSVQLEDQLPQGFSYVAGSSLWNGAPFADPGGTHHLLWLAPDVGPGQRGELGFTILIGADARRGRNVNLGIMRAIDNSGQVLTLEAREFVNVSASGFIFMCGVEGFVFHDQDQDGFYSPVDQPLPNIEVRLSTGERAVSSVDGRYSFAGLFPGEYALGVNRWALPEDYELVSPYPVPLSLFDGLTESVDFALFLKKKEPPPKARLAGLVFYDRDKNGQRDPQEPLIATFQAILDGTNRTPGQQGVFVFTLLEPGEHEIEIAWENRRVQKRITLSPGRNEVEIPVPFSGVTVSVRGER